MKKAVLLANPCLLPPQYLEHSHYFTSPLNPSFTNSNTPQSIPKDMLITSAIVK